MQEVLDKTKSATVADLPTVPTYLNAAQTSQTVRVLVQAAKLGEPQESQNFDILLDAGSPIKPRLESLLAGWQILDWMPDGVF